MAGEETTAEQAALGDGMMKQLHDMYYLVRDGVQRLPWQYVRNVPANHFDTDNSINWTLAEARRLDAYGLAVDLEVGYQPALAEFASRYGGLPSHSWDRRLQYILQEMSVNKVRLLKALDNNARVGVWASFIQLADDAALARWDNLEPGLSRTADFSAFECYCSVYHATTDVERWRVRFDSLLKQARKYIPGELQAWINPKWFDGPHNGKLVPIDILRGALAVCENRGVDTVVWWYGSETSQEPIDVDDTWPILQLWEELIHGGMNNA